MISDSAQHKGLTSDEVKRRQEQAGLNEIRREHSISPLLIFLRQFKSPLIWLLILAGVLALVLGDVLDTIAIMAIISLNALIGFFQEFRSEKAVLALRDLTAPRARVLRDGHTSIIPAKNVVPEDLLLVEAGDIIAADSVLIEAHELKVNESSLTGESLLVEKKADFIGSSEKLLAERHNQIFAGTTVASGTGLGRVTAIGMKSELGKIAHLITTAHHEPTPLQKNLARVGNTLLYLCLAVVISVVGLGFFQGGSWIDLAISSVSLAVAAVPEGLPAIVTIALAFGVQRMAARNVLVRKLPSVETLGSVTVVCTDKTGTLTTGQMAVRELWGTDHRALLLAGASCCDADLKPNKQTGTGDPTEVAILKASAEHGIDRENIESSNPRQLVKPFDSRLKRMAILRSDGTLYVKGALEVILPLCTSESEGVLKANKEFAETGLRVLAVAIGKGEKEADLKLIGLIGIADPPRTEAIDAISAAREAGIRVVMITGDHPITATAIARELGILQSGDDVSEVVHARATAEDKIKIIKYWKNKNEVVAMTGDGVNDAAALREAHIGIAMGRTGTEVTREASDMILTDDNFASIIAAIREGRGVFENIQKSINYLLTGNSSELMIMLGASLLALPLPFVPIHLLWINLVTDGLPALALVADPVSGNILKRSPRDPKKPILGRPEWKRILGVGGIEAIVCLFVFVWMLNKHSLEHARSITFSTMVFSQLFRSFSARSETRIFWHVGAFTNLWLLGVIVLSIFIQISLHYIPITHELFKLTPLNAKDLGIVIGMGLVTVSLVEIRKLCIKLHHAQLR